MLKQSVLQAVAAAKNAVQDLVIPMQLVQRGDATHVPGSAPVYSETVFDIKIYLSKYEAKEIDGDRIRATDWSALAFPEAGAPVIKPNDVIRNLVTIEDIVAGDYRVIMNNAVMAGSIVALNQMQLRRL